MKKYTHVLFDIDNTILNFDATEEVALSIILEKYGPTLDQERLHRTYQKINRSLWRAYEKNEMTKEQLLHTRFFETFYIYDIRVDGEALANEYQQLLAKGKDPVIGAQKVLDTLKNIPKYIVTNGVQHTQRSRLQNVGWTSYFEAIYISEEIGYHKPQIEFFDTVFERSPEIVKETTLIIGDSLTSDIQGGITAGIDTCWINFHHEENTTAIQPTYTMETLEEVLQLFA
ncbi:YjjG family noncanonical pyrimidine nucleotidase [Kurthia senegalensis]|uniref:YjjG family noncanonical pyrimidine nucleotidase n=1 Tax=Kurthia senegalensis TaxID=1033740 RepID=UPI000289C0D7|nr:YjjG family noncanonical pyrimidine nucleotidase [Kurthia senegalensis]